MQATLRGTTVPGTIADVEPGDVVVATTQDASLEECQSLADRGVGVVILASRTSDVERQRYLAAGAYRFLEMTADATALTSAVDAAIAETQHRANVV